MDKFEISTLLYAIVASAIAWFLLWLVYDVMEIWQFLKPGVFANLTLVVCLIVFIIVGGIEQLKKMLGEMKSKNVRNSPRLWARAWRVEFLGSP